MSKGLRLVDLQRDNLVILQNDAGFGVGMDAVLLAASARARRGDRVVDLCCGSGVVPVLMSARRPGVRFWGVEIQADVADMARRSVEINGLHERISIVCGDIRTWRGEFHFDVATVNAPYFAAGGGSDMGSDIARTEMLCDIGDVAGAAGRLLKNGGWLFLVHRAERLVDVLTALRTHRIEPKTLRFVHPYADAAAKIILISAKKGGGPGLVTERPLIVHKEPGVYSDEIDEIYHGDLDPLHQ